jgi:hypothetical protein
MTTKFRFMTLNGLDDAGEQILPDSSALDVFYINFVGPAACQMN